ncbi:MAG: hypothetical protein NW200_10760 [Hyphomonadaceae bacterium]|nr:hypothetical protein [Hyphomonadaceae bacterium]
MHDTTKPGPLDEEFAHLEAALREGEQVDIAIPPVTVAENAVDEAPLTFAEIEALSAKEPKGPPAAGAGFWGVTAALAWIAAAIGAPTAFMGADALGTQHPAVLAGILAVAIAPALMIVFAAAAAREAHRVRRETAELARLATEALAPAGAVEDRARSLGQTVRAEIGALQSVVDVALDRFAELEAAAARNAIVFDQAVASAKDGAGALSATLQSERLAFEDLTTELRQQSDVLGENVGRQIRLMREASRLVRQEYVAADETFQAHLTSFAASAALMAERTEAMDGAATATQMAAQRLDGTIVTALEALSQATTLTDTARQSAENATLAANATASAVRETTQRAVADARRVAHMIRTETQAMEDNAVATLAKLKDAADEARRASEEAQAAADRHAASIQRRLSAMAGTAHVAQKPAVAEPAPVVVNENQHVAEKMYAMGGARPVFTSTPMETMSAPRFANTDYTADWAVPSSANDSMPGDRFNLVEKSPAEKAIELLMRVGVRAGDVFATADLDFIASRARQGGAARRQAVTAAAPEVVARLQRLFEGDAQARADAVAFRAKPDLATQPGGKTVLIAYLLVDAALG